jgi:protein gp37
MTTKRGTKISWATQTWNPVTGCTRISDGCTHCYAETLSLRFGWSKLPWTKQNEAQNVTLHRNRLLHPKRWKEPQVIFVNSMSDLFHDLVPDDFIAEVFEVMAAHPQHTFQILTKRAERAASWPGPWPANIWQGVSVENPKALPRVDALRRCQAQTRFLSIEPLLAPLPALDLDGIHWVIVGGESGPGWRPMDHAWARDIRDRCVLAQPMSGITRQGLKHCGATVTPTAELVWTPATHAAYVELLRHPLHVVECPVLHLPPEISSADADRATAILQRLKHEDAAGILLPEGWSIELIPQAQPPAFFFKQSAAPRTEMGTALEEEDGSAWEWRQFPGQLEPPVMVTPPRATEQLHLGGV